MQNAEPSTSVTSRRLRPSVALALVVHGCGIAITLGHGTTRGRRCDCRDTVATCASALAAPDARSRSRRTRVVPRAARRAMAASSSSCRCSPTVSSTPATTSRCSRAAGRAPRRKLVSPMRAARAAPARQPLVRRLPRARGLPPGRTTSTSSTTTPGSSGRSAAHSCAAGRRSCTRCTVRGPSTTGCSTSLRRTHVHLVAISDAQRARQPRRAVRGHGLQRHRPRTRTRTAPTRNDFLVYIGRANPDKGPEGGDHDRAARGPADQA